MEIQVHNGITYIYLIQSIKYKAENHDKDRKIETLIDLQITSKGCLHSNLIWYNIHKEIKLKACKRDIK